MKSHGEIFFCDAAEKRSNLRNSIIGVAPMPTASDGKKGGLNMVLPICLDKRWEIMADLPSSKDPRNQTKRLDELRLWLPRENGNAKIFEEADERAGSVCEIEVDIVGRDDQMFTPGNR